MMMRCGMNSFFDTENNCEIWKCPVCGYEYHEYYDYSKQSLNTEKPFIRLAEPLLYEKQYDWHPKEIVRCYQYACPKCGILQVNVSEL